MNLTVYEPWINQFQGLTANANWRVAVGRPITYSACASTSCTNFEWSMPDNAPDGEDAWRSLSGGNARSGSDLLINYSSLHNDGELRTRNDWFGDVYGRVKVRFRSCDNMTYQFISDEFDSRSTRRAEVFFDPDVNVQGGVPSTANPPAWFIFWKDGNVVEDINICGYDHSRDYGAWNAIEGMRLGPLAPTWCGPTRSSTNFWQFPSVTVNHTSNGNHLDCVSAVIAHELHHRDIFNEWRSSGFGDEDEDGIPDLEEQAPGSMALGQINFGISETTITDSYNLSLIFDDNYLGYEDEEIRCRQLELIETELKQIFPELDWSADSQNPKW
ncbi:MAG: hypothetical protein AAF849_23435 [Bacteroidota bacterium]